MQVRTHSFAGYRLALAGWIWDHFRLNGTTQEDYDNFMGYFGVRGCWNDPALEEYQDNPENWEDEEDEEDEEDF